MIEHNGLAKSCDLANLQSNLEAAQWQMPEEDYQTLTNIKYQKRMVDGTMFLAEDSPYKTVEDIWDDEACT